MSRRRVLTRLASYAAAWVVVGIACYWIADARMFAACLFIAAMLANPHRPRSAVRPALGGLRAAVHSRPGRAPVRRSVAPLTRARAA